MAGLLVLAHENICQISSRGPVFRPQVKGLHCFFFSFCFCFLLFFLLSRIPSIPDISHKLFLALFLTWQEPVLNLFLVVLL